MTNEWIKTANKYEAETLHRTNDLLGSWSSRIGEAGITIDGPTIERENTANGYSSEVQLILWRGRMVVDVIEWHVFLHGDRQDNWEEARSWIEECLAQLTRGRDRE